MKRSTAALVVVLVTASAVIAQADKRLSVIRAEVAKIDSSAGRYRKEVRDVSGISTEGAQATLYLKGKELKKIAAKIFGETFQGTSEFYFLDGKLIFEYDRINRYDRQIGAGTKVKIVRVEQFRSYFENGKMFRLMIGSKVISPGSDEFAEQEKSSLETVQAILDPENTDH